MTWGSGMLTLAVAGIATACVATGCTVRQAPDAGGAREGGIGDAALGPDARTGVGDAGARDAGARDAANLWEIDSGPGCPEGGGSCTPRPTGCGAMEVCDDGLDNDCNLMVDEGCPCVPGAVQSCFAGTPGRRGVGACRDGTQRCAGFEFGTWGACMGGISPTGETCNMLDDDCNGCTDEHDCCGGDLSCPGPDDPRVPSVRPFGAVTIDGTTIYAGAATSWRWEIQDGPCDTVLRASGAAPTFTTGALNDSSLVFTPTFSGDYTVTMHVRTAAGEDLSCTFVVHVAGEGLRVELCWHPTAPARPGTFGARDLDLYLHEPDTTTPWFSMGGFVGLDGVVAPSSCNFMSCAPTLRASPRTNFGYPSSTIDRCDRGPGGAGWMGLGYCPNPRLDIDGHGSRFEQFDGLLENINVDNPRDGQSFRVMVHDCQSAGSNPLVNVYCGGFLRATIGAAPDTITLPGGTGCSADTDTVWRVADVTVNVDGAGVTTGCDVSPIRASGGGPLFTIGDLRY